MGTIKKGKITHAGSKHHFRKYDIRGTALGENVQLTPAVAELVGKAYGTFVQREFDIQRVFVGSDNRVTSGPLRAAVITGVASTGLHVTDIGEVLTPTVYFAAATHEQAGGIMVTGSHLETHYNGIKMAYGKLALAGEQIETLLAMIQNGDFASGQGARDADQTMIQRHMAAIQQMITLGERKLKVVVDAGNGLSGTYVPPVLQALGVEVVCLYCEPDAPSPTTCPTRKTPN
ncbi:MAG: hypothetical protein HC915_18530 [Anaerolineae bacterium]|nr:hypothetical protein [Anaerolineae bacterium]